MLYMYVERKYVCWIYECFNYEKIQTNSLLDVYFNNHKCRLKQPHYITWALLQVVLVHEEVTPMQKQATHPFGLTWAG